MDEKIIHRAIPLGGLNSDDDLESYAGYPVTDYPDSLNTRVGGRGEKVGGNRINIRGNKLLNWDLPSGVNKDIGFIENKQGVNGLRFIWNSAGNHQILHYLPNKGADGTIELVAEGLVLGFDQNRLIRGEILDGKLCYFTDAIETDAGEIEGNGPRSINFIRANKTGKKLCYKITAGLPGNGQFADGDIVRVSIRRADGTFVFQNTAVFTANGIEGDITAGLAGVAAGIAAHPQLKNWLDVTVCDCDLRICFKTVGSYLLDISSLGNFVIFNIPMNFLTTFSMPLRIQHIDRCKYPPLCHPQLEYGNDPARKANLIAGRFFQFAVRYIYYDNEKTTFGPISELEPDPLSCSNSFFDSDHNFIDIDFTDPMLNDEEMLTMITRVEIMVREGNLGIWKSVKVLEQCEFGITKNVYRFYNDGNYAPLADDETRPLHDWVPRKVMDGAIVDNRHVDAGCQEGDDNIDCVELELDLTYEDIHDCEKDQEMGTVTGKIFIHNEFLVSNDFKKFQPIHEYNDVEGTVFGGMNPGFPTTFNGNIASSYKQNLFLDGFLIYAANSLHYTISTQTAPDGVTLIPGSTRNVYDTSDAAKRTAVRDAIRDQEVFSTFSLDLPPGDHIIRVASHLVSDDDQGFGRFYDLANPHLWQRTSTYVKRMGGIPYLREVKVTVVAGQTIDIGEIWIQDLTNPSDNWSVAVCGYLIDAETLSTLDELKRGARMEQQILNVHNQGNRTVAGSFSWPAIQNLVRTDHNGFWYVAIERGPGIPGKYDFHLTGHSGMDGTTAADIWDDPSNSWLTPLGLKNLDDEDATVANRIEASNELQMYIIWNKSQVVSDALRTYIEGVVRDQNGVGVGNIKVTVTDTERSDITDSAGNYRVLVYGVSQNWGGFISLPAGSPTHLRSGFVLFEVSGEGCCLIFTEYSLAFEIPQFVLGGEYSINIPFKMADFLLEVANYLVEAWWKHRNALKFGIVYQDKAGRCTKVQAGAELYIPFWTEPGGVIGKPIISWAINHKPPLDSVKFQIVRELNGIYDRYVWMVANEIQYVRSWDPVAGTSETTTYSSGDAKEIYISLQAFIIYQNQNSGTILTYEWEPGDRITLVRDSDGNYFPEFYDFLVEGIRTINGELFMALKANDNLPELEPGTLFEVYGLRKKSDNVFWYEFGECFDIIDPGTDNRRHAGPTQNQTANQPARGTLSSGDTWIKQRNMPTKDGSNPVAYFKRLVEDEYVFDNVPQLLDPDGSIIDMRQQSIGRAHVEDPDFARLFFKERIRHSHRYIPESRVNGFSTMLYRDYKDGRREFGTIYRLQFVGNVLLAIQRSRIQPIYIGQREIFDQNEQRQIISSSQILNLGTPLKQSWGTVNPESVFEYEGNCYGWDLYSALWWRYSVNGLQSLSDYKFIRRSQALAKMHRPISRRLTKVIGIFDRRNKEAIWSIPDILVDIFGQSGGGTDPPTDTGDEPPPPPPGGRSLPSPGETPPAPPDDNPVTYKGETYAFSETRNRWETRYSFRPEMFGIVGDGLVSSLAGQLWQHEKLDLFNNFYGVQYNWRIDLVLKSEDMSAIVEFINGRLASHNRGWKAPLIQILPNPDYPNGMQSRLSANHFRFEGKEGHTVFDFLRDMTDPNPELKNQLEKLFNGRPLKGKVLLIQLENDSTGEIVFSGIDTFSSPSQPTH